LIALSFGIALAEASAADPIFLDVASAARDDHQGATVLWAAAGSSAAANRTVTPASKWPRCRSGERRQARFVRPQSRTALVRTTLHRRGDGLDPTAFATGNLATVAGTLGRSGDRPAAPLFAMPIQA
jgi:hypothetical protein